jgi:hypothetical protein
VIVVHLARKPLTESSVAANVLKHGAGAVNVDACRVVADTTEMEGRSGTASNLNAIYNPGIHNPSGGVWAPAEKGRWPANLILQHLPDCRLVGTKQVRPANGSGVTGPGAHGFHTAYVGGDKRGEGFTGSYVGEDGTETVAAWECAPGCPVEELDRLSLEGGMHGAGRARNKIVDRDYDASSYHMGTKRDMFRLGDAGGASRFFKQVGSDK